MSSYPAEHFQGSDEETMYDWSSHTYQQSAQPIIGPSSIVEKRILNDASFSWPIAQHTYTSSSPMAWPSAAHALAVDSLQTPTQAMFSNASSVLSAPNIASSWSLPFVPLTQASCAQTDSVLEQCYPISSALTDCTEWHPSQQLPTSQTYHYDAPAGHGSPAPSDHSESSYSSLIASSPYAQSDGYFQTASPPAIKLEDAFDRSQRSLYSIPGFDAREDLSHVTFSAIFSQAIAPAAYRHPFQGGAAAPQLRKDEDHGMECEASLDPAGSIVQRPAGTVSGTRDMMRISEAEDRLKRGFTTTENSTCHCPQCGKLFRRNYNLRAHLVTHDPERDQPHSCGYGGCTRKFVRRTDLMRHEQSVHLKVRNFACAMCSSAFARKDTLRRHVEDGCSLRPEMKKRPSRRRSSVNSTANLRYGSSSVNSTANLRYGSSSRRCTDDCSAIKME